MKIPSGRTLRRIACWLTFCASLLTYLLTLEPDASLWDCPEYLVTAARLEIGHPPGNPLWTLTARVFSLFGGSDPQAIAICVNISSAVFTAGAAAILTSVIFILLHLLPSGRLRDHKRPSKHRCEFRSVAYAFISAATGLTFAWSDSPWFSAVEAEVYALSLFLTALSVRLMIGWSLIRQPARRGRQLLLIIYLTGLSIGVHQLNLLVIPALALIGLFRHYPHKAGIWRILATLFLSAAAVGAVLLGFMPGVIWLAGKTELFCVNHLKMPIHSGVILFWAIAVSLSILLGLYFNLRRHKTSFGKQVIAWIPAMLLIGFSGYMIILVRSAANPPMNEGDPSDIFSLAEYLNRDQYGKTPLLYGKTPHSMPLRREIINADGKPDYSTYARKVKSPRYLPDPDRKSYRHYSDRTELTYTPELDMWLPRMTSSSAPDIACYGDWAGMTPDDMESVEISYALDSLDRPVGKLNPDGSRTREKELRPTYLQQLRYLFGYQIGYMYFRYLLWNFSGRQNDRFATGEAEHGNFLTGIAPVDNAMLGSQEMLPAEIGKENRGNNIFYCIPLLLGIIGMIALQRSGRIGRRANLIIAVLFLMTGVAIVIYLNQNPREVRERDYSFLGSFWAYAIWIGAGIHALLRFIIVKLPTPVRAKLSMPGLCPEKSSTPVRAKLSKPGLCPANPSSPLPATPSTPVRAKLFMPGLCPAILLGLISFALPAWLLAVNYDDHDRSGRSVTTDFATNLLESLEPNAILFTNGDNFTFPLWWAQEVAGIRRDVSIVNTAYLVTPWYVCQLMKDSRYGPAAAETRKGLLMQAQDSAIRYGAFTSNPYTRTDIQPGRRDTLLAEDALTALGKRYSDPAGYRFPGMLRLPLPAEESPSGDSIYIRTSAIASGSGIIGQKQLAALDIIASNLYSGNPRPVYWLASLSSSDYAGFYPLTTRTLHTRRLMYTDSLTPDQQNRQLDRDLSAAFSHRSGNKSREKAKTDMQAAGLSQRSADTRIVEVPVIYADATVGPHISTQRLGLIRLAQRLLKMNRKADALQVTLIALRNHPATEWEYQIHNESEGTVYEGFALADLLIKCASAAGADSISIKDEGMDLLKREHSRHSEWERYYRSLPPRLRQVLTPKHRQFIKNSEL